jgi:hypothetical protein
MGDVLMAFGIGPATFPTGQIRTEWVERIASAGIPRQPLTSPAVDPRLMGRIDS